jgi:transcriptional regulator with XRE-family HTH domain
MKLVEYRHKANISQAKLADRLGIDVTTVSKYETGSVIPSVYTLRKIYKVTCGAVTMDDFFEDEK